MTRRIFATLILSLVLAGCGGRAPLMTAGPDAASAYRPQPGKAVVVFLRPSRIAPGVRPAVFDVSAGRMRLVGVFRTRTKVAYHVAPGKRRFMVVGENADFMAADLAKGKTYYAIVAPRPGMWKARFSLRPVHLEQSATAQFAGWLDASAWVENTPASTEWAEKNMPSIKKKHAAYLAKWNRKATKPTLARRDGK